MKLSQHRVMKLFAVVWYPNAGTVLLQSVYAEIKFIIFISLSCYLTTLANFSIRNLLEVQQNADFKLMEFSVGQVAKNSNFQSFSSFMVV